LGALKTAKDVRRLITIAARLILLMTVAVVLFYLFIVVVIEVVLPAKYAGALVFLPWLMGAAYFNSIYFIVVQPIFFYRQVRILSISGLFICVTGLAMIYGFSMLFGPIGVAMGMFGSRFILFAIAAIFGTRLVMQNMPQEPKAEVAG
jgi:O-antigen/teichoic acid export membrane protein